MTNLSKSSVLALLLSLAGLAAGAAEQVPLDLDGHASLNYPPDALFELGPQGTIDFWVRAGWSAPLAQDAAVVANADAQKSRYTVYITGDGQALVLWDGKQSAGAEFNFLDGKAHHVAIVTRGSESDFYVDSALVVTKPIGYGSARGLPFHVGTSDGTAEGFVGQVRSVRLWSTALSDADVLGLRALVGEPPATSPLARSLRVYSDFTATSQELVLLDPSPAPVAAPPVRAATTHSLGAAAQPRAAAEPPPAAPPAPRAVAPPAPVDPGVQMWKLARLGDGWRIPPSSREAFADFRRGAVDFWVQFDPSWVTQEPYGTLVAYSNGYETVFEVGMAAGGDGIVMANAKRDDYNQTSEQSNTVSADFTDGLIHHVALVTEDDATEVFVDGRSRGVASVGYALAEDASGPKTNLQLSIGSLDGRNRTFQGQIGGVRVWGAPLPGAALFRAAFLRDDELTAIPWADSFLVAQIENLAGRTGKPALRFLPPLFLPAGTWMLPTDAERKLANPGATLQDADWTFRPQSYVHLVVTPPDSELARFAGAPRGAGSAPVGGAPRMSTLVAPAGFTMTANAGVGGRPLQTVPGVSLEACAQQCRASSACVSFDYVPDVTRCEINDAVAPLRQPLPGSYSFVPSAAPAPAAAEPTEPTRSPLAATRPADSAANATVPILVWLEFKPFESMSKPDAVIVRSFKPVGRNRYSAMDGGQLTLTSRVYLDADNQTRQRFDVPDRPPRQGQPRIDDVFIVGNQVRNRRSALQGWDPIQLNPFDFSNPAGGKKADVFAYSPYGYSENARMVIPKGFEMVDLQSGGGRKEHTEITTEAKLQQALGASISVGGGVEGMVAAGSFSANASFNMRSEKLNSGTSAFTLGQAVSQRVALVLDKANVKLSTPFRQAVVDAVKSDPTPAAARRLVEQFGTHYANSIVLGGRIVEMVELDAETWGAVQSMGLGVGIAVEGRVGPPDGPHAKASAEAQMEASQEESFRSSVQKSKENWYYSGGQAGSSGGSWLVTDETMAPIYLDLRPLSELLAPPFFMEPEVFDRLRPLVRDAMRDYVTQTAGTIEMDQKFTPKRVAAFVAAKPKQDCAANGDLFRRDYNTDSDYNNGGGVYFRFMLPGTKHGMYKRYDDGCFAETHWEDGWLVECNRVCWRNAMFKCNDGAWEAMKGYESWEDVLCHETGSTQQDDLDKGKGKPPWN